MWALEIVVSANPQPTQPTTYFITTNEEVTIGRPAKGSAIAGVDIVLTGDSAVSKEHCILQQQGDELRIKGRSSSS